MFPNLYLKKLSVGTPTYLLSSIPLLSQIIEISGITTLSSITPSYILQADVSLFLCKFHRSINANAPIVLMDNDLSE